MTNRTKWLAAIPFSAAVALGGPALITGNWLWFLESWADSLYTALTAGMWLAATAFVDVSKPRGRPDQANRLISLGLILSVPVSVADRVYFLGSKLPGEVAALGAGLCVAAILLGLWARISLGRSYSPRGQSSAGDVLVQSGPYQLIRHPMYTSACLWSVCWPLLVRSIPGAVITGIVVMYAVKRRIDLEEISLVRTFGARYTEYQKTTWRLLPFIY